MSTILVTNLLDSGPGSLRAAITAANGDPTITEIRFQDGLNGSIPITFNFDTINTNVAIIGPGPFVININNISLGSTRIFTTANNSIDVNISGLSITNGSNVNGGGILIGQTSQVTLTDMIIDTNRAIGNGGGIFVASNATCNINSSVIINNTSDNLVTGNGAGIFISPGATVNIDGTTITENTAIGNGGGVAFAGALMTITNSTISSNTAGRFGGGISTDANGSTLNIRYSTINNNSAALIDSGDGLDNLGAILNISNSTFSQNAPTRDTRFSIFNSRGGVANLINVTAHSPDNLETIVNGNTSTLNIGNSIVDVVSGTFNPTGNNYITSDEIPVDPFLGPLTNNGGPTETMLPLASALLGTGTIEIVDSPTDQRGLSRTFDGTVDIGAVQVTSQPICYSGESLILALNTVTKKITEVKAKNIYADIHKVYDTKRKKFIPIKYNIISGPVNRYMKIAKDTIAENIPNNDLLITSGHKVVINSIIMKARKVPGAIRIKVEPEMVYSICTEKTGIIVVNGLSVLSWSQQKWLEHSKKNSINWIDNKPKNNYAYSISL